MGIQSTQDLGKYLGIPAIHSRITKDTYQYIVEKAQSRLAGWKAKTLTLAGRVTLTRSVLSSLPFYAMQVMYLPRELCKKLDQICRNFIWGTSEEVHRVHLVKWEDVCKPRELGGLGIRSATEANDALIIKLGWRFLTQLDTLWSQVLHAKYVKRPQQTVPIIRCKRQSVVWSGISNVTKQLAAGIKWSVGDGQRIRFWTDEWIPGENPITQAGIVVTQDHIDNPVSAYWNPDSGWKWELLNDILPEEWKQKIRAIFVDEPGGTQDHLAWKHTSNGIFSTKSAYLANCGVTINESSQGIRWKSIWSLKIPERIRYFLWTCVKGRVMTNMERCRRKFTANHFCPICRERPESLIHMLRDCPRVSQVWRSLIPREKQSIFFQLSPRFWLLANLEINVSFHTPQSWNTVFSTACWWLWKWRNMEVFEGLRDLGDTKSFIHEQARLFEEAWKHRVEKPELNASVNEHEGWRPPPLGWFKINVDGSSRGNPGKAGGGGLIRDAQGRWVVGFLKTNGFCDSITSEVWAIWQGLKLAHSLNLRKLIVESDSLQAVGYITEGIARENSLYSLVTRCNGLLGYFDQTQVTFTRRENNRAADCLANLALNLLDDYCTLSIPPESCLPFLQADAAFSLDM